MRNVCWSQAGVTLIEVVVYAVLLSGVLLTIPVASFRLMRTIDHEVKRLTTRVDMQILDQRLAQVFACGEVVEVSANQTTLQCIDHNEYVTAYPDGSLEVVRSNESVGHIIALPGYIGHMSGEVIFTRMGASDQFVRVRLLYQGIDFTKTYYAATAL